MPKRSKQTLAEFEEQFARELETHFRNLHIDTGSRRLKWWWAKVTPNLPFTPENWKTYLVGRWGLTAEEAAAATLPELIDFIRRDLAARESTEAGNVQGVPARLSVVETSVLTALRGARAFTPEAGLSAREIARLALKRSKPDGQLWRALARLKAAGLIDNEGRGPGATGYFLTDPGRNLASADTPN